MAKKRNLVLQIIDEISKKDRELKEKTENKCYRHK